MKILNTWTKKMKCDLGRIECYGLGAFQWDGAQASKSMDQSFLLLCSFSYAAFSEYLAYKSNSCNIRYFRPLMWVVKNTSPQGLLQDSKPLWLVLGIWVDQWQFLVFYNCLEIRKSILSPWTPRLKKNSLWPGRPRFLSLDQHSAVSAGPPLFPFQEQSLNF